MRGETFRINQTLSIITSCEFVQLKRAILDQLNLESRASHVTAMAIAWNHQPYIDGSLVQSLVAALDAAISEPPPSPAGQIPGGSGGLPKPKRKKKKKPGTGGEEECEDDGPA